MVRGEFEGFQRLWAALAERYGRLPLSGASLALDFAALVGLSLSEVERGVEAHLQHPTDCRFFPMPGQVIANVRALAAADGRPGPEEAWAIGLAARDEAATVVWTAETAEAWDTARHVFALGDEVGARMAFREKYTTLVAAARAEGRPVEWQPSIGHDRDRVTDAIRAAAALGRRVEAAGHLMALPDARGPVALLEGPSSTELLSEVACAAIHRLRQRVTLSSDAEGGSGETHRYRSNELKALAKERAEAYAAAHGIDLTPPNLFRVGHQGRGQ
jgi:hypothetical protein